MCAQKIILDSDEEDEEVVETTSHVEEVSSVQIFEATSSLSSGNRNEQSSIVNHMAADGPQSIQA